MRYPIAVHAPVAFNNIPISSSQRIMDAVKLVEHALRIHTGGFI